MIVEAKSEPGPVAWPRTWWGAWPAWTTWGALAWSAAFTMLGALWWSGVPWYPFAPVPDERASGSLLEGAPAGVVGPVFVLVGVLGVAAAAVMLRGGRARRPSVLVIVFGALLAVAAAGVIPDYTALALLAMWPALLVFAFTGVPGAQDGIGDILYWHRDNLLLIMAGGLLWAAAILAYARRARGDCGNCGRSAAATERRNRSALLARGRRWVWIGVLATLPYDVSRVAWWLGRPLGLSPSTYAEFQDPSFMLTLGLILAAMSTGGALLTHGLVARWGERFPRRLPVIAGRRVPTGLAVVPAGIVALAVVSAALMFANPRVNGHFSLVDWGTWLPSVFWLVWALGIAGAARCYYLRRRGPCRHCGRGLPSPE